MGKNMSVKFITICCANGHRGLTTALALILLFVFAPPVSAHKVHIFAYVDGDLIQTESRFNGDRPAQNCTVKAQALTGNDVVASGTTDEQGLFAFPLPSPAVDMDIIISCGDGHRGSWRLEVQDFSSEINQAPHVHSAPEQASAPTYNTDNDLLRKLIAEEVEKKLGPLRRDIARLAERKTSLPDILGGIGYLLGLAGLAAYLQNRKGK